MNQFEKKINMHACFENEQIIFFCLPYRIALLIFQLLNDCFKVAYINSNDSFLSSVPKRNVVMLFFLNLQQGLKRLKIKKFNLKY